MLVANRGGDASNQCVRPDSRAAENRRYCTDAIGECQGDWKE
jgi:putative hemolysin